MEKVVTKEYRKAKVNVKHISNLMIIVLGSTHLVLRDVTGMLTNR